MAAPTDCMGLAADGKKKCTAPQTKSFTYNLCTSSLLIVAENQLMNCFNSLNGGSNIMTSEATLSAVMGCVSAQGGPAWKSSGSGNAFYCGGAVTHKYGNVEVVGIGEERPYPYGWVQPTRSKKAVCPPGYNPVGGSIDLPDYCALPAPPKNPCEKTENPMGIANGDHGLVETDLKAAPGSILELTRYYSSSTYYRPVNQAYPTTDAFKRALTASFEWGVIPGFGDYWRHTYDRRILAENSANLMATALRHTGVNKHFRADGTSVLNEDGKADRLARVNDAQGNLTGWIYTSDEGLEYYNADGILTKLVSKSGKQLTMTYGVLPGGAPDGQLLAVTDDFGRSLTFSYDTKVRLTSVSDGLGAAVTYTYGPNDAVLTGLTYRGGAARGYLYNENPLGLNGGSFGLTGVIDEFGNRFATYGYASGSGQAYTEHIGQTYRVQRSVIDSTHVGLTDSLGATRVYTLQDAAGVMRVASQSQPAGAGCIASVSNRTFDAAGNVAINDDFNGNRTCSVWDQSRALETTRVEGLATSQACATVTSAGASIPTGGRKISTQWHPDWRLEVRRAEPKKLTTYVYNGQPDPSNGNAAASCAPPTALLPDGRPIAVLCKTIEQATTDSDGGQGFSATTTGAPRVTSATYNQYGQVLTQTDPRNFASSFAYYGSATADYNVGDLQSITNPAGHATQYPRYDAAGRNLRTTQPNGLVTDVTYSPRGMVSTVTVTPTAGAPLATGYIYNAAGKIQQVSLPDGTTITYTYDIAHRLTGIADSSGNAITYTLDSAGNRVAEEHRDAGGTLARNITRVYDALNRLQYVSGAAQ